MAGRLLSLLADRPRLIVSLPRNDLALAEAAARGGAEALKVHINVVHEASGTRFGALAEEQDHLQAILSLGLPTGIVPGAGERRPTPEEMEVLADLGMDFFDLYAQDTPCWLIGFSRMTRGIALSSPAQACLLPHLEALGFEMVEAAIIPHEGYRQPLSAADVSAYRALRAATHLPIIVPTQRAIQPQEVPVLVREAGANAVMIGAVVTGSEPASLRRVTERFAEAMARV